jgi:hypothetical protein
MNNKNNYEITIFQKFLSAPICPYKINNITIRSLDPPKPDICVEIQDTQKLYFELTECVCESIAQQTGESSKALRTNKEFTNGHNAIAFKEDSLFNKSMEKFGKSYQADGPIELLSYFNQQAEPLGDVLSRYDYFVKECIEKSPFRRVWVYDVFHNTILYYFPKV